MGAAALALIDLLGVALDHATQIQQLFATAHAQGREVSKDEIAALMAFHAVERQRVQAIVDALPDQASPAIKKA